MTLKHFYNTIPSDCPANLKQRYLVYLGCASTSDTDCIDCTTGKLLKTFNEWVSS